MTRLSLLAGLSCLALAPDARAQDPALAAPGGMKRFDYDEVAVYPVIATPGRITDIALEPGETLVGAGPIAAGDTARWVIGDTTSGAGATRRVHVLVKPTIPGLATNLIINSERRTYHLELRSSAKTWQAQVSWRYRGPDPTVVPAPSVASRPVLDLTRVNRAYRIEGDRPAWRPVAVFDDGQRTYVEFGPGVALSDLPPLYRLAVDGKTAELINYHVEDGWLVTERLFDRAELRLGSKRRAQTVRLVRQGVALGAAR